MAESLRGHLLVASPKLSDANFRRTVILMLQHDSAGAVGLVLNRPTPSTLDEIWKVIEEGPCPSESPLYWGGPVSNALIGVHRFEAWSDTQISPELHIATTRRNLTRLLRQSQHPYRLFVGYSGWGADQLDQELELGGWLVASAASEVAFYEGDDLWEQTVDRIGEQILRPALGRVPSPPDPRVN
jgi:putative transcriptional regulator